MTRSLFFIAFVAMTLTTMAQEPTNIIRLYEDAIPGQLPNDTIREQSSVKDGILTLRDITEPTLTMWLPPKDKATGASVLIIPGGGYWVVASGHEGEDLAKFFVQNGIAAFVLKYRLPDPRLWATPTQVPLDDARQAMRIIRNRSLDYNIHPRKIGVMGFSAGGHLASTLCTHSDNTNNLTRPNWAALIYPVITFGPGAHIGSKDRLLGPKANDPKSIALYSNENQVDRYTPPTFLVHSADDDGVPVENSILYFQALKKRGVAAELHIFPNGGHGYGMARTLPGGVSQWPELCLQWIKYQTNK